MAKTLTYEQMMALFAEGRKETAEQGAELRASIAKQGAELRASIAEQGAELRASIAEQGAELRASIAEQQASISKLQTSVSEQGASISKLEITVEKNNAMMEKNNAMMEENNRKVDTLANKVDTLADKVDTLTNKFGMLTNKLGGIVEEIVIPGIVEKFNEKGFGFDSVSTNVEFLNEKRDGNLAEVDALLENGKFVIAVETKTDLQVRDVNKHIKRLKILREMPRFKGKKIYGALATAVSKKRPVNYALEQGFYVLQRPDTMGLQILDFPKGCRAKAF